MFYHARLVSAAKAKLYIDAYVGPELRLGEEQKAKGELSQRGPGDPWKEGRGKEWR